MTSIEPTGAQPGTAPAEVAAHANEVSGPAAVATAGRSARSLVVPAAIGFSLIGVVGLLVAAYLVLSLGPGAFALGGVLAVIPLVIVLLGVRWIDRWEPEPRSLLVFSFLWGAVIAIFAALVVGLIVDGFADAAGLSIEQRDFFGSVFQAPIVEETAKGLGILLVFFVARKHFDGPVDGVVYAATIAAGFAFTENILYFGADLVDPASGVLGTFIMRGLLSPFAHVMFTTCTGLALGIAARRTGTLGALGAFLLGLVPAIALHMLWNGATYVVGGGFLLYYVLVQVPLFIAAIILIVQLRKQESRVTRVRLDEYAAAGWFNPDEVAALATPDGRRRAISWARQRGLGTVMRGYITDATRLAFVRQRLVSGRATEGAQAEEAAILASILARRAALPPRV